MHYQVILLLCLLNAAFAFVPMGTMNRFSNGKSQLQLTQKDVNMPALSSTMKEGKIVSWNKKVGDKVKAGDVLLVVESDKADMDVESFEDGYLAAIYTPEGGSAKVGHAVATLVDNVADIGKVSKTPGSSTTSSTPASAAASSPSAPPAAAAAAPKLSGPNPKFATITMPALSSTMKEGKIQSWTKKVGDKISANDVLLVVESDKADMDVETYEDGYLAAVLVGAGGIAKVGATLAYIAPTKDDIPKIAEFVKNGGTAAAATSSGSTPTTATGGAGNVGSSAAAPKVAPAIVNDGRVSASGYAKNVAGQMGIDLRTVNPSRSDKFITSHDLEGLPTGSGGSTHMSAPGVINATPMARKLAIDNNLESSKITGTGNFGRVTQDDVLRAAGKLPTTTVPAATKTATPSAAAVASSTGGSSSSSTSTAGSVAVLDGLVAMDGMQKAVAKNMEKTLSVPVFRVSREIVTDKFDELYAALKPKGVTASSLIAKAVAEVLKKHPLLNAAYSTENGGSIKFNKDINIAMAVAIEGGLITPTIVGAQNMDLFSIGRKWKELVDKAKEKKLTPAEYSSGTFTISNLGMFGVQQFGAILPPATGSILAISASLPKVVQLKNGHFGVQKAMTVTITCDHRHIYGAHAAEFLKDLADLLENNVNSLTMG